MKKVILISITLFFFSLAVNAQNVTKDNVMDYVNKIEVNENNDTYISYRVEFTDYEYTYIYHYKNDDYKRWCDSSNSWGQNCFETKKEVIYWVWKKLHD